MEIDSTQPIGHIKYRNVRFGSIGNTKYTHRKRIAHIKISVATVATVGLPIPRRAAPNISLIPQMKYVLEITIIFCLE